MIAYLCMENFRKAMKRTLLLLTAVLLSWLDAPAQEVRNVIYLIGDGMGLAHVAMLQIEGGYAPTAFDRAQHVALVTTRSANNRVTDSAAAGTALATGVKTVNSCIGLDSEGEPLESMMTKAGRSGMATGIVVTSSLLHATPAAFYAHVPKRYNYGAIVEDLLESGIDLLWGGGAQQLAEESPEGCSWADAFRRRGYRVVSTLEEAEAVAKLERAEVVDPGRLLAALAPDHLPHAAERGDCLPRAVNRALEMLSADADDDRGFLLMVEGSQIDMAAHAHDAQWLLDELRDFERAVAAAMDFADRTPGTLVVVVADHETGGLTIPAIDKDFTKAENGLHYDFGAHGHTAIPVLAYLYGAGSDRFGAVIDNTQLAQGIMSLLDLE